MRLLSVFCLMFAMSLPAQAAERLIMRATVGPVFKTYAIPVRNCARNLSHVRIDILQNPVFVQSLGIKLSTGQVFTQPQNRVFPVGAGGWNDISPIRGLGCITAVFATARSETRAPAKIAAYGRFQ